MFKRKKYKKDTYLNFDEMTHTERDDGERNSLEMTEEEDMGDKVDQESNEREGWRSRTTASHYCSQEPHC